MRPFAVSLCLALTVFGCRKQESARDNHGDGPGGVSITIWTEKSELFVEFPQLVAGKPANFAAHLTRLSDFTPLTEGTVAFVAAGLEEVRQELKSPTRPGIWIPTLTFPRSGCYELTLRISGPQIEDTIAAGKLTVFASEAEIPKEAEEGGSAISYLKEQQWRMPFATARVGRTNLMDTMRASGQVGPRPDRKVVIVAPVSGRYDAPGEGLPLPGAEVAPQVPVGTIQPLLRGPEGVAYAINRLQIERELAAAQMRLDRAEKEYDRVKKLFENRAKSQRDVDDAELEVKLARSSAETVTKMKGDLGTLKGMESVPLVSPFKGTIVEVKATPGAYVEAGTPLFTIIDLGLVWVEANLFEDDAPRIPQGATASFTLHGNERRHEAGRHVNVGSVVDENTRTVRVIFEFENGHGVRIGNFVDLSIDIGKKSGVLAIPESAILDEDGIPVAYVQTEGESFEKRVLTLGARDRGMVEVLSGLEDGERVASKGAYLVKLASMSSQLPAAHGHPH